MRLIKSPSTSEDIRRVADTIIGMSVPKKRKLAEAELMAKVKHLMAGAGFKKESIDNYNRKQEEPKGIIQRLNKTLEETKVKMRG